MFAVQKILRIYAFIIWLVCILEMRLFFLPEKPGLYFAAVILSGVILALVSEVSKLPGLLRAGILMTIIIILRFSAALQIGLTLMIPIEIVLITIAASTFLSRQLLIYVGAMWNFMFIGVIIFYPKILFDIFIPTEYLYIFVIMESSLIFSYLFVEWAREQLEYSRLMTEDARNASRVKGEFLANMSHEIRTPMNAIVGMTELIIASDENSSLKDIKSKALHIKNAGNTLVNLVNDILEINKIEQDKVGLFEEPYNVRDLISTTIEIINVKLQDKPIAFLTDLNVDLYPELTGDAQRIKQILINLLTNAVKYTEQGHILLKVNERPTDTGVSLDIVISDTGIGIRDEDLKKLFGTYQQFDLNKNKNVEGTGLGLSITKKYLDAMDSSVHVSSVYGKGTKFMLGIPQRLPAEIKKGVETRADSGKFKVINTNILIVDDNKVNLAVITGLFKLYNIKADTALSGKEALEKVKKQQYDIIYMDHMMPEMDGIETVAAIRSMPDKWCANVPIVALTANVVAGMEQVFLDSGMNAFVAKPVNLKDLERTLLMSIDKNNIIYSDDKQEIENTAGYDPENIMQGIDMNKGMDFCGGTPEGYAEVLKIYYYNADSQIKIMRDSYDCGDMYRLTLEAHSLKSASRGIGADELGDDAFKMEMAGKDKSYIDANIESLLNKYRETADKIGKFLKLGNDTAESPAKELSVPYLCAKLDEIANAAENYDLDSARDIIDELLNYSADSQTRDALDKLKTLIMQFSYSDTIKQAKALKASICPDEA